MVFESSYILAFYTLIGLASKILETSVLASALNAWRDMQVNSTSALWKKDFIL